MPFPFPWTSAPPRVPLAAVSQREGKTERGSVSVWESVFGVTALFRLMECTCAWRWDVHIEWNSRTRMCWELFESWSADCVMNCFCCFCSKTMACSSAWSFFSRSTFCPISSLSFATSLTAFFCLSASICETDSFRADSSLATLTIAASLSKFCCLSACSCPTNAFSADTSSPIFAHSCRIFAQSAKSALSREEEAMRFAGS